MIQPELFPDFGWRYYGPEIKTFREPKKKVDNELVNMEIIEENIIEEITIRSYEELYKPIIPRPRMSCGNKTIKAPMAIEDILTSKNEEYRAQREDIFRRAKELIEGMKNVKCQCRD